ncbi:50S ribosomal protein L23, partial [Acinetobacter baumannii]
LMNEGKFTFEVDKKANKIEVKQACEALFNVKVEKVNIVNVRPKKRRVGRYEGFKPSMKKAIVTLAEGQTIEKFEV